MIFAVIVSLWLVHDLSSLNRFGHLVDRHCVEYNLPNFLPETCREFPDRTVLVCLISL